MIIHIYCFFQASVLYGQGITVSKLGSELNKSRNAIMDRLKKIPQNVCLLNYETLISDTLNGALKDKLAEEEVHLLEYISKKDNTTQKELAEQFNLSRRIVQHIMKNLQDKGVLERIGSRKNGRWIVACKKQ